MKDAYIAQHGDNVEGGSEQQYLIYLEGSGFPDSRTAKRMNQCP
jgi:hypothetical protein